MARQIVVDIVGDASKFTSATRSATDSASGLSGSFGKAALSGAAMGAAFSAVNLAVDAVGGFLMGASEAAKEDTESQDRLALALKNTGQAQELSIDQIEAAIAANQAKGVSDSEQRKGISDFLDLTGSATEALKLNTAVTELAAAKGISYADAETMIKSAAAGKTAALQKAGVEIEKGASITDIATAVNDKFGGSLDAVAETQSGKASIASEKLGEAQERVGVVLNKVAIEVLPVLMGAFADIVDFLMENVVPVLSNIADVVVPVLRRAFEILGPIVKGVFEAIGKAAQVMGPIIKGIFDGVLLGIAFLQSAFGGLRDFVLNVWTAIGNAVRGAINGVIGAINGIIRAINGLQVHIHLDLPDPLPNINFDWYGLRLGYLPYLHAGGIVPGAPGEDVLAILQAGERVIPAAEAGGSGGGSPVVIQLIVDGNELGRIIDRRLYYASRSRTKFLPD